MVVLAVLVQLVVTVQRLGLLASTFPAVAVGPRIMLTMVGPVLPLAVVALTLQSWVRL